MTTSSRALLAAALLAAVPCVADAKSVLVVAAHPDDEIFMGAGRARAALTAGDQIKMVIVTNGDAGGVADGYVREQQSVASAQTIGLQATDVVFMGYGDSDDHRLWHAESQGDTVYPSPAGVSTTYAGPYGYGGTDFHRHWTNGTAGAPYTRNAMLADFRALIREFLPDEIYTHGSFDRHLDHTSVTMFIHQALLEEKRAGTPLRTKVYEAFIWMPHSSGGWADPWPQMTTAANGFTPLNPIAFWSTPCRPGECLDLTNREASRAIRFLQPPEMRTASASTNLKAQAIPGDLTVQQGWFGSWVRKDEVFWLTQDLGQNIASSATLTFSSQHGWWLPTTAEWVGTASQAVDGLTSGITGCIFQREWLANTHAMGEWIQLTWPTPQRISQVNLFDRWDPSSNVTGSHLTFSDGTTYDTGALEYDGKVSPVYFDPPIVTTSVRFTIDGWLGNPENTGTIPDLPGLQEIQVFGVPVGSTANNDPYFVWGPYAASTTIPASRTIDVAALARDLDGDPLTYTWSADAGFIAPYGVGYAHFTPPPVATDTFVSINVQVSDGRGGTASNWWHVLVTPAPTDSLTLSPATVFGTQPSVGTVVLATAAGAGGRTVTLTSEAPAVASVPASVFVAAGQTTATFPITTYAVGSATTAVITANFSAGARSANLVVAPRAVSSVSVSPSSVLGGNTVQGTVTLPVAAAGSGVVVALSSDAPAAAVPASVTVPAGQTSATFPITTSAVSTAVNVTIGATYGTSTSTILTVSPLAISSIVFDPAVVLGGTATTGTVALNGTAPTDVTVTLSSADPSLVTVPATVTVLAGASTRSFTVTTSTVTGPLSVTVTAASGGATASAPLTLTNHLSNENLLVNGETLTGSGWDNWGGVTVTANAGIAPNGSATATRFVATSGAHAYRQQVNVAATQQYTFSFWARNNGGTTADYSVFDVTHFVPIVEATEYISSTVSGWTRIAVTFTTPVDTTQIAVYPTRDSGMPMDVLLWGAKLEAGGSATGYDTFDTAAVTVAPTSIRSGDVAQGLVEIGWAAPAGGVVVPLASSDPAVTVPASVTVVQGATSAAFAVSAGTVAAATPVTITAAFPVVSRTASVTVNPLPRVASVSLSPTTVSGGGSSTGTVTLTEAALAGGLVVQLSSGNAAATVPASVTVPQGASTATFTVTTSAVATDTSAVITATGGASATATLTISALAVSQVSLSPAIILGGSASTATVTLSAAAPAGGAVVTLSSSDPAATVPASVTVLAFATTATFTVTTSTVATNTAVTIGAAFQGSSASATLSVRAPVLTTVTVSPSTVTGGVSASGTVTLNGPAPTGGLVVTLSSSAATTASVPAQVTVSAGTTSAGFTVTTIPVASDTPATITASAGTAAPTATLTVARPRISSLSVSPTVVLGGTSSTATVRLNGRAPAAGLTITLGDNSAAAAEPASVAVAADATTATFTVTTVPVGTRTTVTLSAAIGADTAVTTTLTIARPAVSSFAISPTTVVGGGSVSGTVTLNGPAPAGGVPVTLTARPSTFMSFPSSVTVAEGATTASVTIGASPVTGNTNRTITASAGGVSRSASFTITPPAVSAVSLSPTSITGGGTVTGTVTLNGPAPAGTSVALTSGNTAVATVPASVAVTTGATTATFTVTTLAIPTTTSVSIGASFGGGSASATLSVGGFTITSLTFAPSPVVGGYPATGTIVISGTAPAGGFPVTLTERSAAVSVPTTVTIPQGSSSTTFTATTAVVASPAAPTITASVSGSSVATQLSIIPLAVSTVSVSPATVVGGSPSTGTVTLNANALADTVVVLGSSVTATATVAPSVTVLAGSSSATFPITTTGVTGPDVLVSISATLAGTASATLTVTQ